MRPSNRVFASVSCLLILTNCVLADTGKEMVERSGIKGGLVVHVGCGDGALTSTMRINNSFLVHGLDADQGNIDKARARIKALGLYGQISVNTFDGDHLPYTDNLVNLIIADDLGSISEEDLMRVLAPGGVAYVGSPKRKVVKAWPSNIDEWTHYMHNPANNMVADDQVGPPRHIQWKVGPLWDRAHDTLSAVGPIVSANGRLFSIIDTAPIKMAKLRGRWQLIARDAFNGKLLWKRDILDWEPIGRPYRTGPTQLHRRLVAVGDRVFATLQDNGPVTMLDAATGETLRTFEGTEPVQEIIYEDDRLFLVSGHESPDAIAFSESGETYFFERSQLYAHDPVRSFSYLKGRDFSGYRCAIIALETKTGKILWSQTDLTAGYHGSSLAIGDKCAIFQTAQSLTCLDRNTGKALWVTDQEVIYGKGTKGVHAGSSITVVVSDEHEMVYTCHPGAFIIGYALKSGEEIWRTPVEVVNYHAPPDLFVIGDTIWANDETGYDAKSGEAVSKRTFSFDRPMGHDRCYRGRATPQYIIESKSGGADFSVLNSDEEFANPWIRGACQYGVLPCNGLLYAPPHPCQCARSSMLAGFYAMAPEREGYSGLRCSDVLEKGPSFGINRDSEVIAAGQNEWPTFRHNEARGSATKNYVGKNLKVKWKKKVASTRPSASTIVDGKVFLADVDAHSVIALEQESGNTIWEYTTGARVDTPPTWHDDSVLFGSRDGWVYCLRAEDGDLIWRFRAAPEERYVGVHEQIESEWPVHGSVLVKDGNAYFSAGRSSFMGNGVYLYSLDAKTGKKIDQKRLHGPLDEEGHPVIEISHHNDIVGAKSSILSANGDQIYLRHLAFDNELREVREDETDGHIMPSAGFLDDQLFHRSLWTFGRRMGISERPDGDVLVLDDDRLYCHVGHGSGRGAGTTFLEQGYAIFGGTVEEVSWTESRKPEKFVDMDGKTSFFRIKGDWKSRINLAPRAMIKAGEYLYVAGTVHQYPPEQDDPWGAVEGRKGNMLEVYKEEEKVLSLELDGFPVWDGMAAANGKLFISLMNGDLLCLAE